MLYGVEKIDQFALAMLDKANLDDLLWSIAQGVGEIMGFSDCVVYLCVEDVLIQKAAFGVKCEKERKIFKQIQIPLGVGIVGTVASTGVPENIGDVSNDSRYIHDQYNGRSELAVPVVYENRTIAVIDSESEKLNDYSEMELRLLQVIANIAAPRIVSAIYQEELEREQQKVKELNKALLANMTALEDNQQQLVESEKMASIGFLAAGVAHEINTPLGYCLSNMQTFEEYQNELVSILQSLRCHESLPTGIVKLLQDSELEYILTDLPDLTDSITKGLLTAKDIVVDLKSFSNINNMAMSELNLNTSIRMTVKMLRSELTPIATFKCSLDALRMYSEMQES